MEIQPAAYFLLPGAVAVIAHRFASAHVMSTAAQVALAVVYSALTFGVLATPIASIFVTRDFPVSLFDSTRVAIGTPDVAWRLLLVSVLAGGAGLLVGRALSSRRTQRAVVAITGRNLFSSVWNEAFHNAPRQWIRLRSNDADLIGWLESASDNVEEHSLLLSHVFEVRNDRLMPVVGDFLLLDTKAFTIVSLLGPDVAGAIERAKAQRTG